MRRRQLYAQQHAAQNGSLAAVQTVGLMVPAPPLPADQMSCPKCSKIIKRRGNHLHTRSCKGKPA